MKSFCKDGFYLNDDHHLVKVVNGEELFYSPLTQGWRPARSRWEVEAMYNPSRISAEKAEEKKRYLDASYRRRLNGSKTETVTPYMDEKGPPLALMQRGA